MVRRSYRLRSWAGARWTVIGGGCSLRRGGMGSVASLGGRAAELLEAGFCWRGCRARVFRLRASRRRRLGLARQAAVVVELPLDGQERGERREQVEPADEEHGAAKPDRPDAQPS